MLRADAIQRLDDTIINLHGLRVEMEILDNFTVFLILGRCIDNLNFIYRQNGKDLRKDFECIAVGDDISNKNGR